MDGVKDLRERYQLSRPQLSDLFCIPYRTVQSWELDARACPLYLFRMMEELLEHYKLSGELERFKREWKGGA